MSAKRQRTVDRVNDGGTAFIPTMHELEESLAEGKLHARIKMAATLLEHRYYDATLCECDKIIQLFHRDAHTALAHQSEMASASRLRGKALLQPLLERLSNKGQDEASIMNILRESAAAFSLALILDPCDKAAKADLQEAQSTAEQLFGDEGLNFEVASDACECSGVSLKGNSVAPVIGSPAQAATEHHADTSQRPAVDESSENHPSWVQTDAEVDVIVVGAGASGIGVAVALVAFFGINRDRLLLLERGAQVGTSFQRWPKEMRFISPSFNQQGWTGSFDLNSIALGTSPAVHALDEHLTGEQYARYLQGVARDTSLPVRFGIDVTSVRPLGVPGNPLFEVHAEERNGNDSSSSTSTSFRCRFVVWAAGEFQYPKRHIFPGADFCCHNSTVRSWREHAGSEFIVIGGYESGIDAAINLASTQRDVAVLASSPCWKEQSRDPSAELAPYTRARLKQLLASESSAKLRLLGGHRVTKVEFDGNAYKVHTSHHEEQEEVKPAVQTCHDDHVALAASRPGVFVTSSPPILAVGFEGSIAHLVKDLFDWEPVDTSNEAPVDCAHDPVPSSATSSQVKLTEEDESTKTEGFFLVGPQVGHEGLVFCFVYKFRQRFAVVASAIAGRLGKDVRMGIMTCRSGDMFLDDFAGIHACCGDGLPES